MAYREAESARYELRIGMVLALSCSASDDFLTIVYYIDYMFNVVYLLSIDYLTNIYYINY